MLSEAPDEGTSTELRPEGVCANRPVDSRDAGAVGGFEPLELLPPGIMWLLVVESGGKNEPWWQGYRVVAT